MGVVQRVSSVPVDISVRMKIFHSSRLNEYFSSEFSAGYMDRYDPDEDWWGKTNETLV